MTFIWPLMLILLLLVPAFVMLYVSMQQRRRSMVALYGDPALVREGSASKRMTSTRRHLPAALFLAALAIIIVALARPQAEVSLPRLEGNIILAFDVSGSMAADDMKPTRMDAAKEAAKEFIERQPSSVNIGVVSFSDGSLPVQVPTNDQAAILAAINRLGVQKGTSLGQGIQASLNAIAAATSPSLTLSTGRPETTPTPVPKGTYNSNVIVLLTDGENNEAPDPLKVAQMAADRGVRIYTVGIGTSEGSVLHLDGFSVRSRLDEATLQQIAQLTGGEYYNAANEEDLRTIYDNLDPELVIKPQNIEVTALFAGAGILVLLAGGTLSLLWLSRLP